MEKSIQNFFVHFDEIENFIIFPLTNWILCGKIWRRAFGPGAPKSHYTTPSRICQLMKCTNLHTRKLPKFGYFANCI